MIARNIQLSAGILFVMCLVIGGRAISRHSFSIVPCTVRTFFVYTDPLIYHSSRVVATKLILYKGPVVVRVNIDQ